METAKEKQARKARAAKQLSELGWVSLRNRKSPDQIRVAMEASSGNERLVCQLLKCTAREFSVLLATDKELGLLWQEIRQSLVAEAEGVMATLLNSKSEDTRFRVAKYILDKRGAALGYGESKQGQEIVVKDGEVSIKQIFGLSDE